MTQSTPIHETLVDVHIKKLSESIDILLTSCAQSNNIATDANMSLMKRTCTDAILKQYSDMAKEIFRDMQNQDPKVFDMITINKTKAERIELANKAIQDREALKIELTRKLQVLRKSVPEKIRHQMQSSITNI